MSGRLTFICVLEADPVLSCVPSAPLLGSLTTSTMPQAPANLAAYLATAEIHGVHVRIGQAIAYGFQSRIEIACSNALARGPGDICCRNGPGDGTFSGRRASWLSPATAPCSRCMATTGSPSFSTAPKDQSNRRRHLPGYAAWEIHPVMALRVVRAPRSRPCHQVFVRHQTPSRARGNCSGTRACCLSLPRHERVTHNTGNASGRSP